MTNNDSLTRCKTVYVQEDLFRLKECLNPVKSGPVDLIILDVMMPVMNGLQVCQELKQIAASIPIVLLTARNDMKTRAAAMDLVGVGEFVAKPTNNQDLLKRVQLQLRTGEWDKAVDQCFLRTKGGRFDPAPNKRAAVIAEA